jgi:hypothetical protein
VASFGLPRDVDPFDALKQELDRTYGHVLWLAEVVASFTPEELVWGQTLEEVGSGTGQREGDTTKVGNEAGVNTWLKLYADERKHLVVVARAAIECGLAERGIEILERQDQLIPDKFRSIIDDPELALPADERRTMLMVAIRHLRVVDSVGS